MKRIVATILLNLLILAGLPPRVESATLQAQASSFTFYSLYDRIAGSEDLNEIGIHYAALSGDGNRLAFTTYHHIYTVNADGSNLAGFPEPEDSWGIDGVAINRDGSRAFFTAPVIGTSTLDHLYKLEGNAITDILKVGDYAGIGSIDKIQATADGEYVYFLDERQDGVTDSDIWRVGHNGGAPQKIIEDTEVPHSGGGTSADVEDFAISADGSVIAFVLRLPYRELYVLDGSGYRQLTNGNVAGIIYPAISGDGSTIVFRGADGDSWYAIQPDGSNLRALETASYNNAGIDLSYDGSSMIYNDNNAHGGRLTHTDGSGHLDLLPHYPISLYIYGNPNISEAGHRLAFTFRENDYSYGLYVGHLNNTIAVTDAPTVYYTAFDPVVMPRNDPAARVTLTTQIGDPQGLPDITGIATEELLDGIWQSGNDCPAYFNFSAHDDGITPDQVAGDGVFSTLGQPGNTIDSLDQVTIRVAAQDASKKVVVADTTLFVGATGQMPILPPTNLQAEPGAASIELTWVPSPSVNLAGYDIYRSTSTDAGFTKINAVAVVGDRYLDSENLTRGAVYYYYAVAVDSAYRSSVPSNHDYAIFGQLKLVIPDAFGANGASVSLPVNIANADGVAMCAVDISLVYDPAVLTATSVTKTALTAGYNWAENLSTPGIARAIIATAQGETLFGEGALFNVQFDVHGEQGDTSNLEFLVSGTAFYDCSDLINPVPLDLWDVALFTVQAGYTTGDLDGNGLVTQADASLALEIAVGNLIPTPEQASAGDVNGDGRINAADAALIMRLAAGLPPVPDTRRLSAALQADSVTLSLSGQSSLPQGGSSWIPIQIDDATLLAGADFTLNYDPFIATLTGARTTALTINFDVAYNLPVAGQARIALKPRPGSEDGLGNGTGALVEVQFTALSEVPVGSTSPLNLVNTRLNDPFGRDFASSSLQVRVNQSSGLLTVVESAYSLFLPTVLR
jgi:hypothetical protein